MEDDPSRIYARYVPRLIIERLVRESRAVDAPSAEGLRGSVLFADISGFTPLTEAFAERGPAGAEALTRILNDYFGRMTKIVRAHGGDVLKFAGDALMALWRGEDDAGLAEACLRATDCGLALQSGLAGYDAEGHPLSLRVAVGVGSVSVVHVGGQFDRWEFAIAGAPLSQVGRVGDLAERGEVLVSAEVYSRIADRCDGEVVDAGGQAAALGDEPPRRVLAVSAPEPEATADPPALPPDLQDALRGYLPASITRRILAGQTDFLGELRRVTILFVNLPDITYATPLEVAQEAFRGLQKALYLPWEGSINKLSVDDKGISLVAALGLPPFAHEDDAARGAQAALAMHRVLEDLGQRCSIGVTTGRVYCGSVGGEERQEYTIMGDRVNLAARLMQNAGGGILCDAATARRSEAAVEYAEPEEIRVKGKTEALTVYRPLGQRARTQVRGEADVLIGRDEELARLEVALEATLDGGSRLVYVEGEAGVGKSRLIQQFIGRARAEGAVRVLEGAGDAIEQSTSYFAWRGVVDDLFDLHALAEPGARRDRVLGALAGDDEARGLAPLLNTITPLEIPDTALTAAMAGEVRAGNLQSLMESLLRFSAARKPLLLVLDDVHWMDSASWELLRACVSRIRSMLVVLGSRPQTIAEAPETLRSLLEAPGSGTLALERMAPEDCVRLVAHRLGVDALPSRAASLIEERGEGHPYFSEEIGYALRDAGALSIDGREARMAGDETGDLDLPDSIEGIITSRIDRLSPQQQLALKVAACIGRVFSTRLLTDVYPVERDRAHLADELATLERLDITPSEAVEPEPLHVFKHAITRQVAYDLMLYAQRKQLHEAIARWYERVHADDLEAYYPLLAHHWRHAEADERAVHYLPLAAERALRANANVEVLDFLAAARTSAARLADPPTGLALARWSIMEGAAQNALGRLDEARASFERALSELGFPAPANTPALVLSLLGEIRRQASTRRNGLPPTPDDPDLVERLTLAADTVERLFLVYFFANDAGRMLWTTLRATNLGEAIGEETPILIRSYTAIAAAMASIPLGRQVEYYEERAMAVAERLGEPPHETAWANIGTSAALAGSGAWAEIERRSLDAIETTRAIGDMRRWEEATANLALIRTIYGRFDDPEDSLYIPVLETARKRGVRQTEGWGLCIWGMNLLYKQDFEALDANVRDLEPWYAASNSGMDDIARLEAVDLMLSTALRRGDEAGVERWLAEGFAITDAQGRPTQYRVMPALYLFTECVIDWWRGATEPRERRRREKRVRSLLGAMRTYAGIFPIGKVRLHWLRGRHAWYAGRAEEACSHWRACHEAAMGLEMAYDAMLAASSLGHCLPESNEDRASFAELGADLAEEMRIPGSSFVARP